MRQVTWLDRYELWLLRFSDRFSVMKVRPRWLRRATLIVGFVPIVIFSVVTTVIGTFVSLADFFRDLPSEIKEAWSRNDG